MAMNGELDKSYVKFSLFEWLEMVWVKEDGFMDEAEGERVLWGDGNACGEWVVWRDGGDEVERTVGGVRSGENQEKIGDGRVRDFDGRKGRRDVRGGMGESSMGGLRRAAEVDDEVSGGLEGGTHDAGKKDEVGSDDGEVEGDESAGTTEKTSDGVRGRDCRSDTDGKPFVVRWKGREQHAGRRREHRNQRAGQNSHTFDREAAVARAVEGWMVFWDIQNVTPAQGSPGAEMVIQIKALLQSFAVGPVVGFHVFGPVAEIPLSIRNALQVTGCNIHHVDTDGRKDSVDKVMIAEMCISASSRKPPFGIALISGDKGSHPPPTKSSSPP